VKAALLQLSSGDDPAQNLATVSDMVRRAAADGATFVLTPEVTNCVSLSREHQKNVLQKEEEDQTLAGLRDLARELSIWLSVGSLAIKTDDPDGRFANRSFLIGPDGEVVGRYDKIHMFDVALTENETFRESDGYRPGARAVVAPTPFGGVGMTVCYDLRFPHLHRDLAKAGADILLIPAAFSPVSGVAHWEVLLRARAIETGCFVLAAAQTGTHPTSTDKVRTTYGHSMVISPWGEILADGGTEPGIVTVDLDLSQVAQARARIPALTHDRPYKGP
jgi:predicted amidohydrolase